MRASITDSTIITMSWLELVLVSVLSFLATILLLYPAFYRDSSLAEYFAYEQSQTGSAVSNFQAVQTNINQSSFVADASVFLFWMLIGMAIYLVGENVLRTFNKSKQLGSDLRYSGFDRKIIIKELIQKFLLQLVSAIGLYLSVLAVLGYFIPYVVVVFGQTYQIGPEILVQLAVVFGCFLLIFHTWVVLLRLTLLRVRVFSAPSEE